jgi:hypothetical protein
MNAALRLEGLLAYDPEPIPPASQALCFLFLDTGDPGSTAQEILVEGQAAVEAERLHRGDRVALGCTQQAGLWRASELVVVETAAAVTEEDLVAAFA